MFESMGGVTPTLWALGAFATALIVYTLAMLFGRRSRRRERQQATERHLAAASRREHRERQHEQRMQSRAARSAKHKERENSK